MAENQPKKAGEYERPMTGTSSSVAITLGIIAVLAVIIVAVLFLR
jgi:LPXTG-motif cell wall-anchored protein